MQARVWPAVIVHPVLHLEGLSAWAYVDSMPDRASVLLTLRAPCGDQFGPLLSRLSDLYTTCITWIYAVLIEGDPDSNPRPLELEQLAEKVS